MADGFISSASPQNKQASRIRIEGEIAHVELTRGFESIIDAADIALIAGRRWIVLINTRYGHAYAVSYEGSKCILMHRLLLEPLPSEKVDHKDGDGLNNRRNNIRVASNSQNTANMAVTRRNKIGFKGVSQKRNRFIAQIEVAGKRTNLGTYATAEEAAAAYRGAAKMVYGEFAHDA